MIFSGRLMVILFFVLQCSNVTFPVDFLKSYKRGV